MKHKPVKYRPVKPIIKEFMMMVEDMWERFEEMLVVDNKTGEHKKAKASDYFEWCSEETLLNWESKHEERRKG